MFCYSKKNSLDVAVTNNEKDLKLCIIDFYLKYAIIHRSSSLINSVPSVKSALTRLIPKFVLSGIIMCKIILLSVTILYILHIIFV